jgi:hypothetical protein
VTTDSENYVLRLLDCFQACASGDIVTFDMLSDAIGMNVRDNRYRYLVAQAKGRAGKEGIQFKSVRGQGYQRLKSAELVKIGQSARKRVRGIASRASKSIDAGVKIANDLQPDQLNVLLREQSVLGLISVVAREKNLPVVPPEEIRPLTPGQTARAFLKAIGQDK